MSPETITYDDAKKKLTVPGWVEVNRKLIGRDDELHGDVNHFQGGLGYAARMPSAGSRGAETWSRAMKMLYVTEDLCTDVTSHRKSGVLGKEPNHRYKTEADDNDNAEPTPEEQDRQSAVEQWWHARGVTDTLGDHAVALTSEGASYLRLRLTNLNEQGQSDATDAAGALKHIHVEQAGRDQATVYTDPQSLEKAGIFVSAHEEGDRAEITYTNDKEQTVLRVVRGPIPDRTKEGFGRISQDDASESEELGDPLELGGRLLMHGEQGRLVLSESVRSNQFDLNSHRTWIKRINESKGFPELHLVDIREHKDEEGNPVKPTRGPDEVQIHVSLPKKTKDADGKDIERNPSPQVKQLDSADISNLESECEGCREAIYRGAKQLHRFISGDAMASAESRVQARIDFIQDLGGLKKKIDRSGKWLLETVWALAEALAGQEYSRAEASFSCILDTGRPTPEEMRVIQSLVDKGIISHKLGLSLLGVDDPAREKDQIREEKNDPLTTGQLSRLADEGYARTQGGVTGRAEQLANQAEGT